MNSNVADQASSSCPFCKSASLKHFTAYAFDISPPLSKRINIIECPQCLCAWQWPFSARNKKALPFSIMRILRNTKNLILTQKNEGR